MTIDEMIRGLVRAAESKEQQDGGKVWDDEMRSALEEARRRGWGPNRMGRAVAGDTKGSGIERIVHERTRQIEKEGWNAEHDDGHMYGELALAAICYAAPEPVFIKEDRFRETIFRDPWPAEWDASFDKRPPKQATRAQRIRMLEKAGAMLAAEIDRLLREQNRLGPGQ